MLWLHEDEGISNQKRYLMSVVHIEADPWEHSF